ARKLTDFKGEIENFEWSPDGSKLLVSFRKKDADEIEREKYSQKKELGVVSRHITRVFFKLDGKGYLPEERLHLWIVPLQGECLQLTDSHIYDEQTPAWSPDGKKIVFCSNHTEDPDLDLDAIDLFVIPSTGGDLFKIETPVGFKWNPQYSPDGKWVAYFGYEGRGQYWKNISLWVVPEDGSAKAQNLTEKFDLHVSTDTINDLPGALPMMPPTWSQDSKRIYVQVSRHGSTKIMSVSLDGVVEPVVDNEGVIGSFTFDREQSKLSYLHAHMKDPGEVFVHDMATNTGQKLSHVNEELLQSLDLGEVEEVWFKGAADNDLQGWIIKPPDFDKSRKYPSILEIHGGPYVQYGNFFMHEFFFLAANGYVVYFCNPRGGQGYGEEHSKAIWDNWGTVDYEDLMAWTNFVEKTGYIDARKMGVTGGSYGGFMTNWIIGHTNRFKAAVTQRSVSNMVSMYGTSDYNWPLQYEVGDEPPWENHENYWRQSPLKYIKNCQTPTLVIHSE
ncbi:MAG: S9 family peptidase, partial [Theionarchaea archaeon]|nr:S9 family peptidase [Theionarchaea archaeon]